MDRLITFKDEKLFFIDQTKLPMEYVVDAYDDYRAVCTAIRQLKVRGAPAIGVAAGYGAVVAAYQFSAKPFAECRRSILAAID